MSATTEVTEVIDYLRSPAAIRERCGQLFDLACHDRLKYFRCDLDPLQATAAFVIQVTQAAYPDWQVPFHSRWRHFEAGGIDRWQQFPHLSDIDAREQARIQFDLAITSVLLDAGAGADWSYQEPNTATRFSRSEGLAVASFHLFQQGGFSSQADRPWQADAVGLQRFSEAMLADSFQVTPQNPLVGLAGRVRLLQQLGQVIAQQPILFGESPRLGNLVDYLCQQAIDGKLAATQVFAAVLQGFSEIWAGRITLAGVNLGDVWMHSALPDRGFGSQLVPFHKLSQWLTYSLLEPLQALGLTIVDLDRLTGLAEYRNGGLCLDMGLLQVKQPHLLSQVHPPDAEIIVEWRALTVVLLDRIAAAIRQQLQQDESSLPLVKILEGGTWAAGRKLAASRRAGAAPPLQIASDGTVF